MRKGKFWVNPNPGDRWWRREVVTLRKAARDHFCDECHDIIPKGTFYYEDKFVGDCEYFESERKSYIHRVCCGCWRGVNLVRNLPWKKRLNSRLFATRKPRFGDS